ncbi:NAD(P)/FAD-dependent oxidoreductase [Amycolatopsis mediterranei]|uniref:FAD-dependent oxidoreductase n=1 Tax=Amycolatopsis mediterranei TaxID=33910 RepID=UPI00342F75AC
MSPNTRTALIVGGGIAGPIAAMALSRAGIEATVHEAHDSRADGVGGGMSIAPNGLNALDTIGAGEVMRNIGTPMTSIVLQSWTGRPLGGFGVPPGLPAMQFVKRADLYASLYDEAARRGIRIRHGNRVVGVEESGDGVTAHFADGTSADADILIGADGIRSTVRSLIDPAAPQPHYGGLVSFGALVKDTGLASTRGKMFMSFGKRAFFGYQVFDDGSGAWFVNLPHPEPMTQAEARARGAGPWLRELAQAFTTDRTPAADMISRTDPADLLVTGPVESLPNVPSWSRGRMVLIGDAAHAASSSSGQGASLAIESAVQLARCLRDLPHEQAFARYEELRRPRVERIIAAAARTNSNKAAGPVARMLRDLVLPVAMKLVKPEKSAWQFDYRIDWSAHA